MTTNDSYRVERTLRILAILTIIFVIFGFLTFTGVIDKRRLSKNYCILSDDLVCSSLNVEYNSINFGITNSGKLEIVNLIIKPKSNNCDLVNIESLAPNEYLNIKIPCQITASKGKRYSESFDIDYYGGSKLSGKNIVIGRIKDIVG